MSEPTAAQEAYAADMALDAQIDAWYDANRKPVNEPDLSDTPDPEPPEPHCTCGQPTRCVVGKILDYFKKRANETHR